MSIIDRGHPHFDTLGSLEHTPVNQTTYRSKATGQFVNVRREGTEYIATAAMYDGSPLPVHAEPLAWGATTTYDVLDIVHAQR